MAGNNVILLKRSSVPSLTPSVTSLSAGEIAVNVSDGTLFTKKVFSGSEEIVTFLNTNNLPYKYIPSLSAIVPIDENTNNTVTQSFGSVLGGYNNDVTGGGSTVLNGEDNDIAGDFALIGGGWSNFISSNGDYSAILGGKDNTLNHQESFIIGSNITSHASNFTYVNNLSATNKIYGDGSELTGITSGDVEATTLVRTNSANWSAAYSNQANYLPLSGGTVTGNLSVLGDVTYFETSVGVTSAVYIDTFSNETALRITQRGTGDVIRIEDNDNPDSTPFLINSDGVVGVGTSSPNEKLTVSGNTSATGIVYSEEFAYNSTERPDLTGVKQALDELLYVTPSFNSLIVTGGNSLEVGQTLSTPVITWTTNKTFNSITLTYPNGTTSTGDGAFLSITDTSSYTYTTTTGTRTWSVQGVDWKNATANRSTTVSWYYRVYMGAFNTVTPSSSDVLINSQHSVLGSSRTALGSKSITLNNEYFYVAYPSSFGVTSQLKVNGLNFTDLASVYTITPFTNAYGGTANYYVYRTNNKLTGTYTMEVL